MMATAVSWMNLTFLCSNRLARNMYTATAASPQIITSALSMVM